MGSSMSHEELMEFHFWSDETFLNAVLLPQYGFQTKEWLDFPWPLLLLVGYDHLKKLVY